VPKTFPIRLSRATVVSLGRETFDRWMEDKASGLAAALAYYALFSLAPLLLIVTAVAGLVFGQEAAEGHLYLQISDLVGKDSAKAIQAIVANVALHRSGGVLATLAGVGVLVFGATGVFAQLQDSLNTVWRVRSPTTNGILDWFRVRFLSFSMVMGVGFLLLVSLVLSALLAGVGQFLGAFIPGWVVLGHVLNVLISLAGITVLFAMMYKVLPDTPVAWRDVWLGALVTSFLFTVGKFAIGFYLGQASVASSYGAAGSVVIVLLWVYYSSLILYLGAEFTHVYALRCGSGCDDRPESQPALEPSRPVQPAA
jgi:membrane protein